jgi:20S proteasome alpha/beta subunit
MGKRVWKNLGYGTHNRALMARFVSFLTLHLILTTATFSILFCCIDAAQPSRRRYGPSSTSSTSSSSSYDRLISTFSPQGRLEQVEYSSQAATRTILITIDRDRNQILVVAPTTGSRLEPIFMAYPDDTTNDTNRTDGGGFKAWMIGTGIAGDVLWLRDFLRQQALDHAIVWDNDRTSLLETLAQDAERHCHRRTFVAGARPLGAAIGLFGFSNNKRHDNDNDNLSPALAKVSGWSGASTNLEFAYLGPHQEELAAFVEKRKRTMIDTSAQSAIVDTLLDAAQQVLGTKTSLDLWIVSSDGGTRQYTNVCDRASRRRLHAWLVESENKIAPRIEK